VKVAAAQLAESQARLDRADIRAPADGIVLTRTAEIGQMAAPGGEPLFRLARGGEVEMRGQIAEQDLPNLRVDQPVDVYVTGIATPFEGTIRLLGAVIDPQTRLGEVRVTLKPDPRLRPGAFARGEANIGEADRPILPKSAVLADGTQAFVMIVNPDGKVSRRAVKIGQASADGIVIVEGLKGDERIVTTAAGFLRDGEKVEVAPPPATPTAQATP
jgi:RND family efflux transporter MFP subunit